MTLIRGNHDKRAGDPPASLNIRVVPEPLLLGPFALQHEPDPSSGVATYWPVMCTRSTD